MEKNKNMDEVISDLHKMELPEEDQKKQKRIFGQLDKFLAMAKEMGLDILMIVRDSKNESLASAEQRNSDLKGEDDFSVANGLLQSLIKGMIMDNPSFLLSLLGSIKEIAGLDLQVKPSNKNNGNEA